MIISSINNCNNYNNFNLKQYNSEINYMAEKITYNKNYNAISKTVIAVR